jgi:hypothetical protein
MKENESDSQITDDVSNAKNETVRVSHKDSVILAEVNLEDNDRGAKTSEKN